MYEAKPGEPYWLMRERRESGSADTVTQKYGFDTMAFDGDTDAEAAKTRYRDQVMAPKMRELFELYGTEFDAVLVSITYVNEQPHVHELQV